MNFPFVSGVEYGKFILNGTVAFGVRLPNGIEFGLGPNLLIAEQIGAKTSLVIVRRQKFQLWWRQHPRRSRLRDEPFWK